MQATTMECPPRGDAFISECPTRAVLDHVTSKWAVLVIGALGASPQRFSALRRRIAGVSDKMLAQTLRTLEGDGFVHRAVAPTTPPQVTYSLTPLGTELGTHLGGLLEFLAVRIVDIEAQRQNHTS